MTDGGADASDVTVATFNLHAGIDGYGRTFDVVAACRRIDADVLVLEENWIPAGGRSLAWEVAEALGYAVVEATLATGRRIAPIAEPVASGGPARFAPPRTAGAAPLRPIELKGRTRPARRLATALRPAATGGDWGIALLSRVPIRPVEVLEVRRLRRDGARRVCLAAVLEAPPSSTGAPGTTLLVAGTHLGHLRHGSPLQMRALAAELARRPGPAALLGDMNCWGPPLRLFFPGWHRAVKGPTWPAPRPHHQLDHVLVRGAVRILDGGVLADEGSDHRPVRVRLAVGPAVQTSTEHSHRPSTT